MDKRLLNVLGTITTRNESGQHFTDVYSAKDIALLESDGLIEIHRPVHDTGIAYSEEYSSVSLTDAGMAFFE